MPDTIGQRLRRSWNAFMNKDPTKNDMVYQDIGPAYSSRPDRPILSMSNERSIVNSIYNRIAMDVAAVSILHVKLDENGRYTETINSDLNECLTLSANLDQTGRDFIQDIVMSMFDEGVVAVAPIDTETDPEKTYTKIYSVRTGRIVQWYPSHVKINLYDERNGQKYDLTYEKTSVAIINNPFYSVMNQPNSTLKRLVRKLNLLDMVDEKNNSGKLDLIIQLPYVVKTQAMEAKAEKRRQSIEEQLAVSKYGIAYIDGTEHVTQLNRAVENNLLATVQDLKAQLYNELGLTQAIFDGTADESAMLNYYNKTVEPILSAITDEMTRKFISKTARTQGQAIRFFKDPFRLVSVDKIAEIADKFSRNEIMSPNEIRQVIGMKPSDKPEADELRNRNIAAAKTKVGRNENQNQPEFPDEEQ